MFKALYRTYLSGGRPVHLWMLAILLVTPYALLAQERTDGGPSASPSAPAQTGASAEWPVPGTPLAPLSPKDMSTCANYESSLQAYRNQVEQQHAACIASGPMDRPSADGIINCNWSKCERLHELKNSLEKSDDQASACRAAVMQYQNRQAATQGAMQTAADVISSLLSSNSAAPLASQSELSNFERQAQSDAVAGDNSNPDLAANDDVFEIASSAKDANKTPDDSAQESPDDATTTDLKAAIEKARQATENLEASKLDPTTEHDVNLLQYYAQLDAESKTDLQLFKDAVPDALKGMLGMADPDKDQPSLSDVKDLHDDLKELKDGSRNPFGSVVKIPSPVEGFFKAYQPSYTGGPSEDMLPPFSPERQQQIESQVKQLTAAQEQYAQALQALQNAFLQYQIAHPQSSSIQPPATGPQIMSNPHP